MLLHIQTVKSKALKKGGGEGRRISNSDQLVGSEPLMNSDKTKHPEHYM